MLKRRIATLEKTWPRRRSATDLDREARSIARLTGTTYIHAFENLLTAVTDEELADIDAEVKAALRPKWTWPAEPAAL
jgi:hypothetical protein